MARRRLRGAEGRQIFWADARSQKLDPNYNILGVAIAASFFLRNTAAMDFSLNDFGPVVLLTPETQAARDWVDNHMVAPVRRCGPAIALERYQVEPILYNILSDHLTWRDQHPTIIH